MNVFIDTNILLDFFRLSQADLEELRKVAKLSEHKRITWLVSAFLVDEFARNRETVIHKAIAQFSETVVRLHRPNLVRSYAECIQLEQMQDAARKLVDVLKGKVTDDARAGATKADSVIKELFSSSEIRSVSEEIFLRGMRRGDLSQPPGKKDSYGDAIHWEWLLDTVPNGEDLFIVSGDGDFCSPLEDCALSEYLKDEWSTRKHSTCVLFCSLTTFLKHHFPEIRLADEVGRLLAVERFETSSNFATTHNAIKQLSRFDEFSKDELARLLSGFSTNDQIRWILGDEDVKEFAEKVVRLAFANGLDALAEPLAESLIQLGVE
jgi:predicted nucleic acid-binding protein